MFLYVSVIVFTGGWSTWAGTPGQVHPPGQVHTLQVRTHLLAGTPLREYRATMVEENLIGC